MFLFCLVFAMSLCASVYICFVVTCWERADLLALVCGVCCEFVTFPLVSWVRSQELEVRSLNHPYSLKTKSSQCHYVAMTRSETKFQAPLNCRYQEILAKTEHLTIKTMSTGHARHG